MMESVKELIITIVFLGHACFLIQTGDTTILIDPYNDTGYEMTEQKADIVLISHEHDDHTNVSLAKGDPAVLRGLKTGGKEWAKVDSKSGDIHIYSIPSYHDDQKGKKRGLNTIFVIEIGDIRIAHCGDLGTTLTEDQLEKIGKIDITMIPAGGFFTLETEDQVKVIDQLKPRMVIPMHFKTGVKKKSPIHDLEAFKEACKDRKLLQVQSNHVKISNKRGFKVEKEKIIFENTSTKSPQVVILDPLEK